MTTEATIKDQTKFVFRQLDRVRVKGKKLGVAIYEVVGLQTDVTKEMHEELARSETAINFYFKQDWDAAEKMFSELHQQYPQVKLYHLYIERIKEFRLNPPPADWDGVYVHTSK